MSRTLQHDRGAVIRKRRPRAVIVGTGLLVAAVFAATGASAALAVVPGSSGFLGNAESFSVLGGSTVTNTGAPTHVWGNVGVAPGTAIVGFQTSQVGDSQHAADSTATNAQISLTDAYNAAAAETPSDSANHSTVGGQTFVPGVYNATSTMDLTGTVTLDGGGNAGATWVFQAGSTLTTAASSRVLVINGNPCNVYWQVGSSATIGASTTFVGTVLANTSITAVTAASVDGRLLARNAAVTLDSNQITQPVCSLTDANGVTIPPSSPSPSPSATATPSPSATTSPSPSPSASATPSPSAPASQSPSPSASATPSPSATTSQSPSPSASATPTPGATTSPSTPAAGATPAPSSSAGTGTGTGTGSTPAPSASAAPTASTPATRSPRTTPTATPTPSQSGTSGGTGSTTGTGGTGGKLATTGSDITAPVALAAGLFGLGGLLFAAPSLRRASRRR